MNSVRVALAVLTLFLGMSNSLADGHLVPSTTHTKTVSWFTTATDTAGLSHLTRTDGMILITLEAAELVPGDAHTMWVIVFNNPEACSDDICGEDDIFNVDGTLNVPGVRAAGIAIGNGSGNIAKSDGTLEFGARVPRNGVNGNHEVLFGVDFGPHLLTASPHDAEVHLLVQTHGQARGGPKLLEQLAYVESNCTPECIDIQFAVHMP